MAADRGNSVPSTTDEVANLRRRLRPPRVSAVGAAVVTSCMMAGNAAAAAPRPAPPPLSLAPSLSSLHVTRLIVSPTRNALLARTPVTLRVRKSVLRGSSLRVRLNGREVSARVRRGRVTLRRAQGLRIGRNHVYVTARRGRRTLAEARTFYVVRRSPGLARLRVRLATGARADVRVNVVTGPPLGGTALGAVRAAIRSLQRRRVFRAWVNGVGVTGRFDAAARLSWRASLSVSDGLRPGRNRLRVLVAEPERGRYLLLGRSVRMPMDRPLAGAGLDRRVAAGTPVRLDGRSSRAVGRHRLRFHWTLVGRPRGSRARLSRVTSARPSLRPDRPGRYRVRLRVTYRRRGLVGARTGGPGPGLATSDAVTITVKPAQLLVPFATDVKDPKTGAWAVRVGDQFYDNPGSGLQVVTIDRSTLAVNNAAYPGAGPLLSQLQHEGLGELVVLAAPPGGFNLITAEQKPFAAALAMLGVDTTPALFASLRAAGPARSIIGVPRSLAGSGWYAPGPHSGWLQVDSSDRYAFGPQTPLLDTSSASTASSNTMTVGTAHLTASSPSGGGGWHVVTFDPVTFAVRDNQAFDASTAGDLTAILDRAWALGLLVAVQSFGSNAPALTADDAYWLERMGATSTAIAVGPPYAFFGGTPLVPSEPVETNGSGPDRIVGRVSPRHEDGIYHLTTRQLIRQGDPPTAFNFDLYDIVHAPPTPWPYTPGGSFPTFRPGCSAAGTDPAGYAAALNYATLHLRSVSRYAPNLRAAYVILDQGTWSDEKVDLSNIAYAPGNGFTAAQWCNLKAELQAEFDWMDNVKQYVFDPYKAVFDRAGGKEQVDLESLASAIDDSLRPSSDKQTLFAIWNVVAEVLNLASFFPEEDLVAAALDSVQSSYDLASSFATGGDGESPTADALHSEVKHLGDDVATEYSDIAAAMDNERDIVISDYGRLSTLGPVATMPRWAIDSQTIESLETSVTLGAKRAFADALFPIAYHGYTLQPTSGNQSPTFNNCATTPFDINSGSQFTPFRNLAPNGGLSLNGQLVALGHGDPTDNSIFSGWKKPPATLLNQLFATPDQAGFGLYPPWLYLRQLSPFNKTACIDTAP
jgi:hypothetical protein